MSNSDALSPGDVILIYCKFISPQKHKYALCVCPHLPRFFFINSAPRSSKPDAQLQVSTTDLPFLKHDSFVNTGEMVAFSKMDLSTAQRLGHLPEAKKRELTALVLSSPYLTPGQKKIVLDNFS